MEKYNNDHQKNNDWSENEKRKPKKISFFDFLKQSVLDWKISQEEVDIIIMFAKKELWKFLLNDIKLNNSITNPESMKNLLAKYMALKNKI